MTKTIEISEETIGYIQEIYEKLKDQFLNDSCSKDINKFEDLVGEKVFIRTVTYHLTGKIKKVFGTFLELEDAAWIADSGRFMQAISEGVLSEVEPIKSRWFVNTASICDFGIWKHDLPKEQK